MSRFTAGFVLVAVLLVGCFNTAIDPDTRAAMKPAHYLYEIQVTYNAALAASIKYAEQDRCTELLVVSCHDPSVVAALARLDTQIRAAFTVARLATTGDAQADAVAAVRKLLAEFQSELLASRVSA